jgi:hypothetical protein
MRLLPAAVAAASIERNFVMLYTKAARGKTPEISGTALHVEHAATGCALKMVMMVRPVGLVARAIARERNRHDRVLGEQQLEIAIYRGDTQARNGAAGRFQNFLRRQRSSCGFDYVPDCVALPRAALDDHAVTYVVGDCYYK